MKKVDDSKLLAMLSQGIEQKKIAEYFNVSPSFITKRKKQLQRMEIEEPPTFASLTDQQKKFVVSKLEGKTNIEAVKASFEVTSPGSAKSMGSALMKKPSIQASIMELMDIHLTKEERIKQLKKWVYSRDGNVSLKALDQSFRLDGSYAPDQTNIRIDIVALRERADYLLEQIRKEESGEVIEAEVEEKDKENNS